MKRDKRPEQRIPQLKEAEEVTIELDDSYVTSTPTKRYVIQEHHLEPNYQNILRTIARKIKYYLLLWRPVEIGDVGLIPSDFLKDIIEAFPHKVNFKVTNTRPQGEVQITPNTEIALSFKETIK